MYTEALRQIREARARPGAVTSGVSSPPPKRGRKHTQEERRAFYERQGWAVAAVTNEDGIEDGK